MTLRARFLDDLNKAAGPLEERRKTHEEEMEGRLKEEEKRVSGLRESVLGQTCLENRMKSPNERIANHENEVKKLDSVIPDVKE